MVESNKDKAAARKESAREILDILQTNGVRPDQERDKPNEDHTGALLETLISNLYDKVENIAVTGQGAISADLYEALKASRRSLTPELQHPKSSMETSQPRDKFDMSTSVLDRARKSHVALGNVLEKIESAGLVQKSLAIA